MLNLNKLVRRLTIRAKLAIAFVMLTLAPLVVTAVVATPIALEQLRSGAERTLEYNLDLVHQGVGRSIREAEQHLHFITEIFIEALFTDPSAVTAPRAEAVASTFLRVDSSAVSRVRAFDAAGTVRFDAGRMAQPTADAATRSAGGMFYLWMAETAISDDRLILPVELRDPSASMSGFGVIPSVAILQPLRDPDGTFLGVAVAEAPASGLFGALEMATLGLKGTIGLVDMEGRFLYHSERKRDWASLLATDSVNLYADYAPSVTAAMLTGRAGEIRTEQDEFLSFRPITALNAGDAPLVLYRSVALATVNATVRRFLLGAGVIALVVLGLVVWAAVIAARQFTKPIYLLQSAARDLAAHGEIRPIRVETNDELEDLARDFTSMAQSLAQHRENLEDMVAERTRALEETQAELSEIVTHSADAIIRLDADDRVRLWNDGACALFGYERDEALGASIDELIGGNANEPHESAYIARTLTETGSVINLQTVRAPKHGPAFPIGLTQTLLTDDAGNCRGSSLIIRDIRMQLHLEEQMRRSERLSAVSVMAAGLTHELNNPLAVLRNRIELMQRDAVRDGANDQTQKDLSVLGQHVDRLLGITTDLLSFAREDGDQWAPIDVAGVLDRVVRLMQRSFTTKGIEIESACADAALMVVGHESAIETVFVNLLLNALQATPQGGRVEIDCRRSTERGQVAIVTVRDTGPGIPEEVRRRIFEPFFTTKGTQGGTGLGLAVCRSIVERHGGHIGVESDGGQGGVFMVSLPTGAQPA